MKIYEVSPDTIKGSFSDDLILSKLWLLRNLKKISDHYDVAYILGSWYGNLSIMMLMENLDVDKIINVDADKESINKSEKLIKRMGETDRVEHMIKDANSLDYRQLTDSSIVINTSCNNIRNSNWFNNIPTGTLVALQSRNNDEAAINEYKNLKVFSRDYPLAETLFEGQIKLKDPQEKYYRFMKIGIK
jgi:hypothetical protein